MTEIDGFADKKLEDLDFHSIAIWLATGFFLEDKHFYKNKAFDSSNFGPDIKWYHDPRRISFNQVLHEFSNLFESLIQSNTIGKKIILPLSGGLDSRTLATALKGQENVVALSYEFEDGLKETNYAKQIADVCGWEFYPLKIPRGYLWSKVIELANINHCNTEFTHPRQMAVIDEISLYGDIILSGQWGDVLFDNTGIRKNSNRNEQTKFSIKKIAKPGGRELASDLWKYWGLDGNFENEFFVIINRLLLDIDIDNPNSRIRAFKSLHWAKRWANENLKVFTSRKEIFIPYYHDQICEFICTIPEKFLSNRRIQIEYIKWKAPELAKIPWQKYDLDLYKYNYFNSLYFPRRVYRYLRRIIREKILKYPSLIQRNWELQFLGIENDKYLKQWLYNVPELNTIIPKRIVDDYYFKFKNVNPIKYSHPISMILTLAVWSKLFWGKK